MKPSPPKWPLRFLRWFCKSEYLNEIEGDLVELYHIRSKDSRSKANIFFVWNVIRSFRPINLKSNHMFKSSGIFKSYFKIGFRSLLKDLRFSLINLLGLSIGLSVFLTIVLLVQHELSFDKFHSKADRIYEVIQVFQNADGEDPEIFTSLKLSDALRNDMPMVENAVTIHGASSTWAEVNGKRFFEEDGIVAGPQFFELFDFEIKLGEREELLVGRRSIVLSESLATKYFGFDDPLGQEINLDYYGRFTVSGVMENVPSNSFIQFDYIITQDYDVFFQNVASWFPNWFQSWDGDPAATYVLLNDAENKELFEMEIESILAKYLGADKEINRHYLLGMLDLHFNSHGIDGRINEYVKGDFKKVQFMIVIAIIILAMGCFNYINISTARHIKRTREVGVRKAMGAQKKQVTYQFLVESFLMVFTSFCVGLVFMYFLIPYFNILTGIELTLDFASLSNVIPYFVATVILVTLLAGYYPAFYLSKFPVVSILNNATVSAKGNSVLRKALMMIQYTFVISILVVLFVVNRQYNYMSEKPLGFSPDDLLVIEVNSGGVRTNFELMKSEMLALPGVSKVSGFTRVISGYRSGSSIKTATIDKPTNQYAMRFYGMDADGISTMGLNLLRGENFEGVEALDSSSVFINETAAAILGTDDADIVGSYIEIVGGDEDVLRAKVRGVISDFHHQSLHASIVPLVIGYYKNPIVGLDDIVVKLSGVNTISTLASIENIHNKYDTNDVVTWEFMDEMIQRAYEKEIVFRDIFITASVISFFIAMLGMIGLTSYNINSKVKEIGIRKILGASFLSIINMEAKGLVKFLILSSLLSAPLCWWLVESWLDNFEYRITPSPWTLILTVAFVLMTSFLVTFLVSRKVAMAPPAEAIRNE